MLYFDYVIAQAKALFNAVSFCLELIGSYVVIYTDCLPHCLRNKAGSVLCDINIGIVIDIGKAFPDFAAEQMYIRIFVFAAKHHTCTHGIRFDIYVQKQLCSHVGNANSKQKYHIAVGPRLSYRSSIVVM